MKQLQDMTLGQRIALTFIIVLVILFALALFSFMSGRWDEAPAATPSCADEETKNKIRDSMSLGLDRAFQDRIVTLFEVWMKDVSSEQPRRARTGLDNAIAAYVHTRKGIKDWDIPTC